MIFHTWIMPPIALLIADIDECKDKRACQCPECNCSNTWGSYECKCQGDLLYIREHDTCLSRPTFCHAIQILDLEYFLFATCVNLWFCALFRQEGRTVQSGVCCSHDHSCWIIGCGYRSICCVQVSITGENNSKWLCFLFSVYKV